MGQHFRIAADLLADVDAIVAAIRAEQHPQVSALLRDLLALADRRESLEYELIAGGDPRLAVPCCVCGRFIRRSVQNGDPGRTCCGPLCRTRLFRQRQEEAGRLAEEGLPAAEIAARLNSDEDTVNGWLSRRLPRAAGVPRERTPR